MSSLSRYGIDADAILPGLYQGAAPPPGLSLRRAKIGLLVLMAEEIQPRSKFFPGVMVLHAPMDDHPFVLSPKELKVISQVAQIAASHVRKRKANTLITCHAGINRSGIVTALTVMLLTGCPAAEAVKLIKLSRPGALQNESFVRQLNRFHIDKNKNIYVT